MSYTPQGLVTVAFLKTQLDAGRDHLSLFEPLVFDAISQIASNDLVANDVREVISQRTNLAIPLATIQTLLGRCARTNYLRRSGDRFHKTQIPIPPSDLVAASAAIREGQTVLGQALVEHSSAAGITFESPEVAIQELASFISTHKLEILLQQSVDPRQGSLKELRNLARFITERCIPDPSLAGPLKSLLDGILLADVLLMKDIRNSQLKFSNCQIYLDTRILLAALGLNGSADEIATKEGLAAIRNAGAQTVAFERTIVEIRGILRVYEDKLGTTEGRLSLFPNSMTSYMIANRLSPADVKVIAMEIETRLRRMTINIQPFPAHINTYTLNEETLTRALAKTDQRAARTEPRVQHDVDCVAAILTIRAGRVSFDLERCSAVFSTTSGMVVKNVQQWYAEQTGEGISPVVHHAFLTTLAWLKKPAFSPDLKLHELAAICFSAMRPTEVAWGKMLSTLRQYVAEGRMSDDESVAIVANGLTETLLSKLDDDFEADSASINEAIERVREELRREHLSAAQREIERVRAESDARVEAARTQEETAKNEAMIALQVASEAQANASRALTNTERLINAISRLAGLLVCWAIVGGLFLGAVLAAVSIGKSKHPLVQWLITGVLCLGIVFSFLGSAWGISAKNIGTYVETWTARKLSVWLGQPSH